MNKKIDSFLNNTDESKYRSVRLAAMFFLTVASAGSAAFSGWCINHGWIYGNMIAAFLIPVMGGTAMSFYITARNWKERLLLATISGAAHCAGTTTILLALRGH